LDKLPEAIKMEKQVKTITRAKKESPVNGCNPGWKDLFSNSTVRKISRDPSLRSG